MKHRPPTPPARKRTAGKTHAADAAQYTRAVQCYEQGKYDEAFAICQGLMSRPNQQGRACLVMGCIHLVRQQLAAAEAALRTAAQKLDSGEAWFNLALALVALNDPKQAVAAYRTAAQRDPKQPKIWNNLGNLLHHVYGREQLHEVLKCYQRALELQPDYAPTLTSMGFILSEAGQKKQAEQYYRKVLQTTPDCIPALTNLAELCKNTHRPAQALEFFRKAWELAPTQIPKMADFIGQRRQLADWSDADGAQPADLVAAIQNGRGNEIPPLPLLAWPEASPELLRDTAANFARARWCYELSQPPMVSQVADVRGRRIRIGYLSADFRTHAVAHLITDVIAQHDRQRFEVFLYAYGPEAEDEARQALRQAAEHFTSVSALNDRAAAEKIRADGIDLLIDLTGYTTHARLGITALRPAAVIASWLGYIGTLGEPRLADYVIGDAIATPPERAGDFSESLALMPHCFQPNRALAANMPMPDRRAQGLPEDAFVFCSFNQCFKLTPTLWDDWCRRILAKTGNSVLWLAPMDPLACDNLRRETAQRGVDPQRLVFAKRLPLPEHQARIALADLALDTWPYNSGTTASDTLRAGVPLLTLRGETFAGRMAASLLHCIGMDELVAQNRTAYIDLAIALANDPARLRTIKATLASRLPNSPLFDPQRFARDLERLFEAMIEQRARGKSGVVSLAAPHTADGDEPTPHQAALPAAPQPEAAAADPTHTTATDEAQYRLAAQYYEQGKYDEVLAICERLVARPALEGRACLLMGCIRLLRKQAQAAEAVLQTAVQKLDSADAWFNLALALVAVGKPEQAETAYRETLQRNPKQPKAWNNLGNLLSASRDNAQLQQAMDCFRHAVALQPSYAHALTGLGLTYERTGQTEEAQWQYRKALEAAPDYIPALTALAELIQTAQPKQAEAAYRKALQLDPKQPQIWNKLGNLLLRQGHDDEQLQQVMQCCQRALALRPDSAAALTLLGLAYERALQPDQAEQQYRKALAAVPDYAPALAALADLLKATQRPEEALPLYQKAWQLEPTPMRMVEFVAQRRHLADWSPDGPQPADLVAAIEHDETGATVTPFHLLAWPEVSPSLLRNMAARYAAACCPHELSQPPLVSQAADVHGRRIRVGYLSADFRAHAIAHLITDVIARHDREHFEVFLYAYGPDMEDEARQALRQAAEHFTSVAALSNRAAAERIRADGIDLLIDLTGYTAHARLGITALRPAAVIASWLGYIGSLGETRMADYVIGDAIATPRERAGDFSEALALMPHCFQPNRALAPAAAMPVPDRRAEGLPEDAFVFCCFNQCYKLTPTLWDDWCRILKSTGNSVLWLFPMPPTARDNLRRETAQRGVDPQRLIFAKWRSLPEHQARIALADLALDTWPYNSGTTASDTLRAGVPLLTLSGQTFAGRMAASLLHCLGMDELVAKDRAAYVDLAVALAADKTRLQTIKRTLISGLQDSPLFDPQRFARDLERLIEVMIKQHARGHLTRMANYIAQRRRRADWSHSGPQPADLLAAIQNDDKGAEVYPGPLLTWPEASPQFLRDAGTRFAHARWRHELSLPPMVSQVADVRGRRIRVGYLSADFRNHAIAYLISGVISHHDKDRFEVFLYAYGPEVEDKIRQMLRQAAEHFTNVSALNDRAVAERIRADGIDLLVDLTGYTAHGRQGITALRPAAVIASWLGYIGTLGEPRLADYVIGDAMATPPERAGDFSESLALMPHCFLPNPALMPALPSPDRLAEGLPEHAFVFCSFNQCFKLTPALWDDWCRILERTGNSVLWLPAMDPAACHNLRRETAQRGIDPLRLVFSKRLPLSQHQARVALADLALDTWPFNSGTTASDMLRAGVPLLTLQGQTFVGRMAASMLHCLGLDELIVQDRAAYIDLAVALAADPARLQTLKRTLTSRLPDSPLFDPQRFARDLERLFQAMLEQRARGQSGVVRIDASSADPARQRPRPPTPVPDTPHATDGAAQYSQAFQYYEQGNYDAALKVCEHLVENPALEGRCCLLMGMIHLQRRQAQAAEASLQIAAQKLDSVDSWFNLALACAALKKPQQAEAAYRRTLQLNPKQPKAWNNLGLLLLAQPGSEHTAQAMECFERALALQPNYPHALTNLALTYQRTDQIKQAEHYYRKVLETTPDYLPALTALADLLKSTSRLEAALPLYRRIWQLEPDQPMRMADFAAHRKLFADWANDGAQLPDLLTALDHLGQGTVICPFHLLVWPEASAQLLRETAVRYARRHWPQELSCPPLVSQVADVRGRRIRIGYLSADFRNHPVTHLITDVIAQHDRQRFEVFLYAYGPEVEDQARQALRQAADHFTSVSALNDRAAAERIRADGIDLLVELTGYTSNFRAGITALRPAAVIASWLGYIGTLGEPRLADYVIGDAIATPPERAGDFSESLALMPHCFQPNQALTADLPVPDRSTAGLPAQAFVFCCFNQSYKLTPALWDDWCRILERTGNSVLWLAPMNATACDNLRRETAQRGVDPQRLVFAKRLPLPEHQARIALADLALDTWPYNSGTTASDTLRAGVPLLTLRGETFAGRMAASLLHCIGMDELITPDRAAYVDLAVALATDPARLKALKTTLTSRLPDSPLFDPQRFARDLERLFEAMIEQRARGQSGMVRLAAHTTTGVNA